MEWQGGPASDALLKKATSSNDVALCDKKMVCRQSDGAYSNGFSIFRLIPVLLFCVVVWGASIYFRFLPLPALAFHFMSDQSETTGLLYVYDLEQIDTKKIYEYRLGLTYTSLIKDKWGDKKNTVVTDVSYPMHIRFKQYFGELLQVKIVMDTPKYTMHIEDQREDLRLVDNHLYKTVRYYEDYVDSLVYYVYFDKFGNFVGEHVTMRLDPLASEDDTEAEAIQAYLIKHIYDYAGLSLAMAHDEGETIPDTPYDHGIFHNAIMLNMNRTGSLHRTSTTDGFALEYTFSFAGADRSGSGVSTSYVTKYNPFFQTSSGKINFKETLSLHHGIYPLENTVSYSFERSETE